MTDPNPTGTYVVAVGPNPFLEWTWLVSAAGSACFGTVMFVTGVIVVIVALVRRSAGGGTAGDSAHVAAS